MPMAVPSLPWPESGLKKGLGFGDFAATPPHVQQEPRTSLIATGIVYKGLCEVPCTTTTQEIWNTLLAILPLGPLYNPSFHVVFHV